MVHLLFQEPGYRGLVPVESFFWDRTSLVRANRSFGIVRARLRKPLRREATPTSSPPLGPDAPNAPDMLKGGVAMEKGPGCNSSGGVIRSSGHAAARFQ